jgi:hypothetical protein
VPAGDRVGPRGVLGQLTPPEEVGKVVVERHLQGREY